MRLLFLSFFNTMSLSTALVPPALVAIVISDARDMFTSLTTKLWVMRALLFSNATLLTFSFFTIWASSYFCFCLAEVLGRPAPGCLKSLPPRSRLDYLFTLSAGWACLFWLDLNDLVPILGLPLELGLSSAFLLLQLAFSANFAASSYRLKRLSIVLLVSDAQ